MEEVGRLKAAWARWSPLGSIRRLVTSLPWGAIYDDFSGGAPGDERRDRGTETRTQETRDWQPKGWQMATRGRRWTVGLTRMLGKPW